MCVCVCSSVHACVCVLARVYVRVCARARVYERTFINQDSPRIFVCLFTCYYQNTDVRTVVRIIMHMYCV